jgi:hypothetical protein
LKTSYKGMATTTCATLCKCHVASLDRKSADKGGLNAGEWRGVILMHGAPQVPQKVR